MNDRPYTLEEVTAALVGENPWFARIARRLRRAVTRVNAHPGGLPQNSLITVHIEGLLGDRELWVSFRTNIRRRAKELKERMCREVTVTDDLALVLPERFPAFVDRCWERG